MRGPGRKQRRPARKPQRKRKQSVSLNVSLKQSSSWVAKRPERGAQFRAEKLGLFPGGEMSAFVDLVEVSQVAIGAPGPCFGSPIDIIWKYGDCDRECDIAGLLSGRNNNAASRAILPVQPRRRGRSVGQPVQRDVIQHVVFRRRLLRIVAICPLRETWMHQYPGCKTGR